MAEASTSTTLARTRVYRSDRLKARQEKILRVVRREIATRGFDKVTMTALAQQAGVTKKTLYNIYGGKDELLLAAVGEIVAAYREIPADVDPGMPSILASRRIALEFVETSPAYATAMMQSLMRVPADHGLVDVLLRQAVAFTEGHLRTEDARGRLTPGLDLRHFAHGIVAQGFGVIILLSKGLMDVPDAPAISLRGLILLLHGVAQGDLADWLTTALTELESNRPKHLRMVED